MRFLGVLALVEVSQNPRALTRHEANLFSTWLFVHFLSTGCWIAVPSTRNDGLAMKTIQMALINSEYSEALRNLLLRDGTHRVYQVEQPDLRLDGVIIIDGNQTQNLSCLDSEPERFVVITRKGSDQLARIWDAGVRHVVFEGDSPSTAHLAIIAAELRLPRANGKCRTSGSGPYLEGHRSKLRVDFPVIDSPPSCARCRFSRPPILF